MNTQLNLGEREKSVTCDTNEKNMSHKQRQQRVQQAPPPVLEQRSTDEFWVITCYFNPCNYETRLRNYLQFSKGLSDQNVNLLTVELCTSVETAHLRDGVGTKYVRVVADDVLWAKERLLNVALKHLPLECTQVCWCDCDILFQRANWARMCSELLRRHRVVQPFTAAVWLGPDETPAKHTRFRPSTSFARYFRYDRRSLTVVGSDDILRSHPGYAWAARRDVLDRIGGFYDKCILGHGDIIMAMAFCHNPQVYGDIPTNEWERHWDPGWSSELKKDVRAWQRAASQEVAGDVNCCPGEIFHLFHGCKKNRDYDRRGSALAAFRPSEHLVLRNDVWAWTPQAKCDGLVDACLAYFKNRREDDPRVV